jgi:HK97 family phage prohead protease
MEDFGREKMTLPMELSFDAGLGEGMFKGVASAFDTRINSFPPTIIRHGAFAESLANPKRPVRILWQHNEDEPIGVPIQMTQTDKGLEIVGKISDTQRGREALTLMRDGVVTDLSIGFNATKFSFEEVEGDDELVRIVQALDLWEFSPVTWGANPDAKITDVQRQTWERVLEQHKAKKQEAAVFSNAEHLEAKQIGQLHYKIVLEEVTTDETFSTILETLTTCVTDLMDWEGALTEEHLTKLHDLQTLLTKLVEETETDSQGGFAKGG